MSKNYGEDFKTARGRVFQMLKDGNWHDWSELKEVGGVRYSARLLELKRLGYQIEDHQPKGRRHGKRYRMPTIGRQNPQKKRAKAFLTEGECRSIMNGQPLLSAKTAVEEALGSFLHNRGKL